MDVKDERGRSADSGQKRGSQGVLATVCGAGVVVAACFLALIPTLQVLVGGSSLSVSLPWDVPHGNFRIGLDMLSAFFLLPVLVLSALAAVYGGNYLLAIPRQEIPCYFLVLLRHVRGRHGDGR